MRLSLSLALGITALALSPAYAATHAITLNTVQIFGAIDPAKISDYTDYASSWDVSPDASSVTFHLMPGGCARIV